VSGDGNLAVFCDFENVALGVRDANLTTFDVRPVVERLLLKGSILAKKAYCDWDRYKDFKAKMHEAAFELIEIPHARQSGKNSADIRMVVDALDLCYTKEHINTFVIISGDSDFSPLVSKLRENAKSVIGVGVKNSTSDLLINNCDEFIFYDDLVVERPSPRRRQRGKGRGKSAITTRSKQPVAATSSDDSAQDAIEPVAATSSDDSAQDAIEPVAATSSDDSAQDAIELVLKTAEAIYAERGDRAKLWGSMIKQTLKRQRPGFNESSYGFGSFNDVLEEAQARGQLELELDARSGGYVIARITRD